MLNPEQSLNPERQADIRQALIFYNLPLSYEDDSDATGEKTRLPGPALDLLRDARGRFFLAAREAGLNAHQALHTWDAAVETELVNSMTVDAEDYCTPRLAAGLQTTVEEIWRTHLVLLHLAVQTGRPLAEVKAEAERQRKALEN